MKIPSGVSWICSGPKFHKVKVDKESLASGDVRKLERVQEKQFEYPSTC